MVAMFLCGVGITGIQVAINPLVSEISDPAKYSRNLTLFMVVNGAGGYLAPQLVTLMKNQGLHWSVTYWVFTAVALIMTLAISFPKYPVNNQQSTINENSSVSKENHTLSLLTKHPLIYLYAVGIFLYVGVEVGVANTISFYLQDKLNIGEVLGAAAEAAKNTAISNYWGGLLLGRLIGSVVLDRIPGKVAIMSYISLAAGALYLAMHGDINQALWAFPVIGFFISIMFPTIYSTATNSFPKQYSSAISGILCTAIIGGAVIGPAIAKVAELAQGASTVPNWDAGLLVAFACYAYIFCIGIFAKEEK
jgi:fucose permease